jgi:RNA polymerase sigma factor (sigma-70 family)
VTILGKSQWAARNFFPNSANDRSSSGLFLIGKLQEHHNMAEPSVDSRDMVAGTAGGLLTNDWDTLADDELLHHYRDTRAREAFAQIVHRHQPMVFRTCLRLLGSVHDAEDAAQSVFLVLAQRPEVVRHSVEGCLHQLARAAVSELCRSRRRRCQREEMAARIRSLVSRLRGGFQPLEHQELREELDVALAQLPEPLRQAVILRYLEGHSQQEAAQRAGCTRVTMGWRSMKGLERLRKILVRRGVAVAPATLPALLNAEAKAAAALPVRSTGLGRATGTASQLAAALRKQSLLGSMFRKAALVALLATVSLGLGAGILFLRGSATNGAANQAPTELVRTPPVPGRAPSRGVFDRSPAPNLGVFDLSLDIGGPTHGGGARFAGGTYTVQGGGHWIYGDADQFRFVCRRCNGDGEIIARVAFDQNKDARQVAAGVMFREELTTDSCHAAVLISAIGHCDVKYRRRAGRSTACDISNVAVPGKHWVRLIRRGNAFTAYIRPDGTETWQPVKEMQVALKPNLYIGLAVTAHNDAKLGTATFDTVAVRSRP